MRHETTERVVDVSYLAKESKGRGKIHRVIIIKKPGHEEKNYWHKESLNALSAKDLGIYKKIVEQKWNKQMW